MSLREKQSKFAHMVALLILHAEQLGYEITLSWAYRPHYFGIGHPKSLHGHRLAQDINLFRDGEYLENTEAHQRLGEYWESIGGTWGGRFGDGNHYSLEHEGVK